MMDQLIISLGRVYLSLCIFQLLQKDLFIDEDIRCIMAMLSKSGKDVPEASKKFCGAIYFLA
jgi:hypothetical protein